MAPVPVLEGFGCSGPLRTPCIRTCATMGNHFSFFWDRPVNRREFLRVSLFSAATTAAGCAVNPVTGRTQLMFLSESAERALDWKWSPHQFSADFGTAQDPALNAYMAEVGRSLVLHSHRPSLPYSWRVVNRPDVNAYTFPAGSMATTRGLLLALESEAELAAVLGHELAHVCARHAASAQTRGLLAQMLALGVAVWVESEAEGWGGGALGLGMIGAGALLCRYSRDNEREADKYGMRYAALAGYDPAGMAGVMDKFRRLEREKPGLIELLFATHPLSEERYQEAVRRAQDLVPSVSELKIGRERYLDATSRLRAIRSAIEEMQKAHILMGKGRFSEADPHLRAALRNAPGDYAALLMLARSRLAQHRPAEALRLTADACSVYPTEPQAWFLAGLARLEIRQFEVALQDFQRYEGVLPDNPNTLYYVGRCQEGLGRRSEAVASYRRYLEEAPQGEHAEEVRRKLVQWKALESSVPDRTRPAGRAAEGRWGQNASAGKIPART